MKRVGLVLALILWGAVPVLAQPLQKSSPPLHEQIDRLIESRLPGKPAPLADDAQFVRRVYLDLVGRIPSVDEARAFLDDPDPNKRAKLIDRLLASPEFSYRMQFVLDDWLMERRSPSGVNRQQWLEYLRRSVEEGKPLNELFAQIIRADDQVPREAAAFYLARDVQPHQLTRDVGRLFFGVDLQCAQCHEHPHIGDYTQDL